MSGWPRLAMTAIRCAPLPNTQQQQSGSVQLHINNKLMFQHINMSSSRPSSYNCEDGSPKLEKARVPVHINTTSYSLHIKMSSY